MKWYFKYNWKITVYKWIIDFLIQIRSQRLIHLHIAVKHMTSWFQNCVLYYSYGFWHWKIVKVAELGRLSCNIPVTLGCLHHCEALEGVPAFSVPACCSGHGLHFPSCCVFISVYLVQLSSISCLVLCLCILSPGLLLSVWVVDKCYRLFFLWPFPGSLMYFGCTCASQ